MLREERQWSREKAAEKMGIQLAYEYKIESRQANVSLAILASIAHAFGVETWELLQPLPPEKKP
jgi:transcriptional regulator with XRE-family HTH domain